MYTMYNVHCTLYTQGIIKIGLQSQGIMNLRKKTGCEFRTVVSEVSFFVCKTDFLYQGGCD